MSTLSTDFRLNTEDGAVCLQQRSGRDEKGLYRSTDLVKKVNQVEFSINVDQEEKDGCVLRLATYHVENSDTGQTYHANLDLTLTRSDLHQIHEFLSFLLKVWPPADET